MEVPGDKSGRPRARLGPAPASWPSPVVFLCGVIVTTLPVMIGLLVGAVSRRLNPAVSLGAITGSMTSTPALSAIAEEDRSSVPALRYAGTYTFANVFLALA